jgi:hydroxymethylpyrimidine/phosphomethylpyrimidine kinase
MPVVAREFSRQGRGMSFPFTSAPVALTIAGSDCSAGAGLQADLKTFSAHGVYGLTAVTCIVAEVPGKVTRIQPVEIDNLADQLRLLLAAFPVAAVKTGMLYSREIIELVAQSLSGLKKRPKLVVDPVMVATSGDSLLQDDAVSAYQNLLFPLADLITPNLDEAAVLLGKKLTRAEHLRTAAEVLHSRYGCAVLLKGGHLKGKEAVDVLRGVHGLSEYRAPFIPGISTHGTGCTLSAAITAGLAAGQSLPDAVTAGKCYVSRAIAESFRWGTGKHRVDALNHFRHEIS